MIASRLRPFGTTIFSEMSALAARTGAINLGDSYGATIALAGALRRLVTMRPPHFALDLDALAAAAPGARMLVLNSPHNPTGRVLTRGELEGVARVCIDHDLIALCDEVYEHLAFEGEGEHIPLATLPGMAERTLTISSAAKSFSFTGWKVGWCSGPPDLVAGVRAAKQFLSFSGATPLQVAVAGALADAERHVAPLCAARRAGRDRLCEGLLAAGLDVAVPQGGYFVNADRPRVDDAREWCLALPERAGVVAIPTSAFYRDPDAGRTLVRFAFCKRPEVIDEAVARLVRAGRAGRAAVG